MGRHSVDKRKKLHPDRPRRSRPPTTASGDDTLSSETTPHLTSPTLLSGASTSPSETNPHTPPTTPPHPPRPPRPPPRRTPRLTTTRRARCCSPHPRDQRIRRSRATPLADWRNSARSHPDTGCRVRKKPTVEHRGGNRRSDGSCARRCCPVSSWNTQGHGHHRGFPRVDRTGRHYHQLGDEDSLLRSYRGFSEHCR